MISQTAEYALRAVVILAQQGGEPRTTQQLSALTNIPVPYLSKIVGSLSRAGIVRSQRGPGGGFTLASAPCEISMWDVISQMDPIKQFHDCPLGIERRGSHGPELCPLHRKLLQLSTTIEHSLRKTTLDQLLAEGAGTLPLCELEEPSLP